MGPELPLRSSSEAIHQHRPCLFRIARPLTAAEDPFATYHASVEERLSALVETARARVTKTDVAQEAPPAKAVSLTAPVPVPLNGGHPQQLHDYKSSETNLKGFSTRRGSLAFSSRLLSSKAARSLPDRTGRP
jgi:hypothetical protein